jgi:hypothetical protein
MPLSLSGFSEVCDDWKMAMIFWAPLATKIFAALGLAGALGSALHWLIHR